MLRDLFYSHEGKLVHKWDHYFDIYEKYFSPYVGKELHMLEIGISHGGSLQLWKKYFGDKVHIYAIDINPECKKLEEDRIKIFIGSQADKPFLQQVMQQIPDLDIVLDDGGHTMRQQIVSFETLFGKVKDGGLYVLEDTHTSYWHEFQGGLRKASSFIEYSKNLIDSLYEGHISNKRRITINEITRHIMGISFYDSIVVFEKNLRPAPFHIRKGTETIAPVSYNRTLLQKLASRLYGRSDSFNKNDKGKL